MKYLCVLIPLLLLVGCMPSMKSVAAIPAIECQSATYSSPFTTIQIKQAKKTGSYIRFEDLQIINQYFPGFKWGISIQGYKRKLAKDD